MTDTILTPKALANTYSPQQFETGWDAVDQYLLVAEYADLEPGASWAEAASALDMPSSRVKRWYSGGKPMVVKQIETADALGWFDASWDSKIGRAFNLVIAGVLSGGLLGQGFQIRITIDDDLDDATRNSIETAFQVLCGATKLENVDDPRRSTTLSPRENQRLLGRAVHVLGVPKGRKTEAELAIPEYLSTHPKLQDEFVELYVALRGSVSEKGTIDIREERTKAYLQSLADLIEDVTGEPAKVRENGIFLRQATVEALSGTVVWENGD